MWTRLVPRWRATNDDSKLPDATAGNVLAQFVGVYVKKVKQVYTLQSTHVEKTSRPYNIQNNCHANSCHLLSWQMAKNDPFVKQLSMKL